MSCLCIYFLLRTVEIESFEYNGSLFVNTRCISFLRHKSHAKKRGPRGNPERKKVSVCLLFSNQFTFITNMGRIIWMSADIRTAIHTARHHKSAPFLNINALWTERCMEFYISSLLSNRKKKSVFFSLHFNSKFSRRK